MTFVSRRIAGIPGFGIDRVAAAAGDDPEVLRLENLDTDLPPPEAALRATREAIGRDEANSYLPFTGSRALREAIARHLERRSAGAYDPESEIIVTCGGTAAITAALFAVTDPGDAVVLTDPVYAGVIQRVRLVGAEPRFAPLVVERGCWRHDLEAIAGAARGAAALFLMSPSMPTGAVLREENWREIARITRKDDLLLLYNAAMESIVFERGPGVHPATLPGMRERTLVVGSVSKEYRMIGWRIGWVAGPAEIMSAVARAAIYTVVSPVGIAQAGAAAALDGPVEDLSAAVDEWRRRRDFLLAELEGLPAIRPDGGWSLLLDVEALGYDSFAASGALLERGRIAATPMRDWGPGGDRWVRLVYSNEPVERLRGVGGKVRRALGTPAGTAPA